MSKRTASWSGRQQRQLSFISEFTTMYNMWQARKTWSKNCLSRAIVGPVHLGLEYVKMAEDQVSDRGIQDLRTATTGLQFEEVH